MKILIVSQYFVSTDPQRGIYVPGGTERYAYGLAKQLHDDGYKVNVLSTTMDKDEIGWEVLDGVSVYRFKEPNRFYGYFIDFLSFANTLNAIKKFNPDIVHAVSVGYRFAVGVIAATKLLRKKTLCSITLIPHKEGRKRLPIFVDFFIYSKIIKWSNVIVSLSKETKECLIKETHHKKIVVIASFFTGNYFRKMEKNPNSILFVGRLEVAHKGTDFLIKALYYVKDEIPSIKLYIVGKGSSLNHLKELVAEYRLEDNVIFCDHSASYDGIIAWDWDFNNDGATDSTEQNTAYEYTEGGVYTVSLKVSESDGDSDSMTKTDYISVTKVNNPPFKPDNPSPSDSATDVSIDAVVLCWTGGDPGAGDTVTYDVYFGTSISPPLVVENQPENTYDLGTLDYSTGYYWQIVATDNHGATTEGEVWAFTTTAAPDTPPIVSNPSATPDTILNDNGRPRIPGTNISQLSVTVTDDTEIDTVTIDLSPIGGSYEAQMTNIPGTDTWTITTNAVEGINIAHDLIVTATDTSGNSDSSVSIQLTILRRGDVDHDNDVDYADARKIKYSMRYTPIGVFIGDVYPATGDNVVDRKDAFYIHEYLGGKADEP